MIFYFSGCGNSRWLAEGLAEATCDRMCFIPEALERDAVVTLRHGEKLGFVFPVYAWAPPKIVMRFVRNMKIEGRPKYVYLACTCGDEAGLTERILRRALRRKGLDLDAAFSFVMPETYINLPGFHLDTAESESQKIAAAKSRMPKVAERINNAERNCFDMKLGKASWLKSKVVQPLFQWLLISDRPFRVDATCIGCGKCATACPVSNISLLDGRPRWHHRCQGCMACYHYCPVNAIHFGRQTKGKGQYYFGHKKP